MQMETHNSALNLSASLVRLYSIYCVNKGASSSVSDVERYVIIRKLLDSLFDIFRYSCASGKFKHTYTGLFFLNVAYKDCGVSWLVQ
jgi:hypothetical protein